jgi:hypothetical protein
VALIHFTTAAEIGGNAFVAAFIGGFVFGDRTGQREQEHHSLSSSEASFRLPCGSYSALVSCFGDPALDGRTLLYAVISLTLVRMVPVRSRSLGPAGPGGCFRGGSVPGSASGNARAVASISRLTHASRGCGSPAFPTIPITSWHSATSQ